MLLVVERLHTVALLLTTHHSPLTTHHSPLTTAKASVTHTTTLDKLDDPLIPTSGYALKLSNEVTGPL